MRKVVPKDIKMVIISLYNNKIRIENKKVEKQSENVSVNYG